MAALFVLARLLPLTWALSRLVPRAIALSVALALTAALVPIAGSPRGDLLLGLLRELCIGGVFALAVTFALAGVPWALRLAQPADSRAQREPLATLYALCAIWLVLSLGGVRSLLRALAASFRVAPLSGALDHEAFAWGVAKLVSTAFTGALGVALPFAVAALVLEAGAALIARASVGTARDLGPVLFLLLAMLLLVPVVMHAPEWWRIAIETAQALTRTLSR